MALKIEHLFDAASSESEEEADTRDLSEFDKGLRKLVKNKTEELETAAIEGIRINHHLRMAREAIKADKPPKGLTPHINVTAYLGDAELQGAVDEEMTKAGLAVCSLLQSHFSKQ
jgi:hypothetical protein